MRISAISSGLLGPTSFSVNRRLLIMRSAQNGAGNIHTYWSYPIFYLSRSHQGEKYFTGNAKGFYPYTASLFEFELPMDIYHPFTLPASISVVVYKPIPPPVMIDSWISCFPTFYGPEEYLGPFHWIESSTPGRTPRMANNGTEFFFHVGKGRINSRMCRWRSWLLAETIAEMETLTGRFNCSWNSVNKSIRVIERKAWLSFPTI